MTISAMQTAARCCALVAVLLVLSGWTETGVACADDIAANSATSGAAPVVTAREKMFAELAADVAEIELRGSILKRVVKLATPSVVHIEAKRETDASRSARGESEEAGSGVIIQRGSKLFVLTNRHVIKYSKLTGINIKLADGRVVHPKQTWADAPTDIAIMAINTEGLL